MKYALNRELFPTFPKYRTRGELNSNLRDILTVDIFFTIKSQLFSLMTYQRQMENSFLMKFGYNKSAHIRKETLGVFEVSFPDNQ